MSVGEVNWARCKEQSNLENTVNGKLLKLSKKSTVVEGAGGKLHVVA